MRTHFGIAQECDKALFDALRDRVLETATFLMHFIPRQPQKLREETLRKTVATYDSHRDLEAALGELGFTPCAMIDEAVGRKLLEHPRNRCRRNAESGCEGGRRNARPFPFQTVDRFEILFG
ncbi:MAG: hypothetical protein WAJ85_05075 [Candidatus Baltobacteraceae bacterium]